MSRLHALPVAFAIGILSSGATLGCSTDDRGAAPAEAGIPDASTPEPDVATTGSGEAGGSGADSSVPPARDAGVDSSAPDGAGGETQEAGRADAALPQGYPALLSETGLFSNVKTGALGAGVRAYAPKYTLWSDGATKRRWLYLPPGKKIDTSDMDFWSYPPGTKVWKEFTRDNVRVETRMLYKAGPEPTDWVMVAYQWKDDLSDADAVPLGVNNARGTQHDIPDQDKCFFCHGNMTDRLLGVTAIQLSHDQPGVNLATLIAEGALSDPPAGPLQIPGTAIEEQALGYLHANCGHCHNARSSVYFQGFLLELWEQTGSLGSVKETTGYRSTVGQPSNVLPQFHLIEPHFPDQSTVFQRMKVRGTGGLASQMPPVGTELPDTNGGVAKVRAWIESMPVTSDAGIDGG